MLSRRVFLWHFKRWSARNAGKEMEESPEWNAFLRSYQHFEEITASKVDGFTFKNSNLIAHVKNRVRNCLLHTARTK